MNKATLPTELFDRFSDLLVHVMGLHLPKTSRSSWENKLYPLAEALGFSDVEECVQWLLRTPLGPSEIALLAKHLTIGETYFFRDANAWKALENTILPELIKKNELNRTLKIWCAACCTGEEPYSMAMLLHRLIADLPQWKITILGTDLNAEFLQKAQKGVYKEWSFRLTPPEIRNQYFIKQQEGGEKIVPEIQQMVTFMQLNLVEDTYPSLLNGIHSIDILLCNNVLIYFSPDKIHQAVRQMTSALNVGGWFLTSAVEVPYITEPNLQAHRKEGVTFFQKSPEHADTKPQPIVEKPLHQDFEEVQLQKNRLPLAARAVTPPKTNEEVFDYSIYSGLYLDGHYRDVIEKLEGRLQNAKQAHSLGAKHFAEIMLLAKSYANLGALDKALQWLEISIKIEKLDSAPYLLKAVIYQEKEQIDEAIATVQKVLFLDPHLIIAYYILGNLLLKKMQTKEAKRNFRNALELLAKVDPEEPLAGGEGMTASRLAEVITAVQERLS